MSIIDRILFLMQVKGVSAARLSRETDLNHSAITEWKKGKANPSLDAVIKLSKYFQVSTDYLLGMEESAPGYGSRIIAAASGGKATKVEEACAEIDRAKRALIREIAEMNLDARDIEQLRKIVKTYER